MILGEIIPDIFSKNGRTYHSVIRLFPQKITATEKEILSSGIRIGLKGGVFPKQSSDWMQERMYEVAKIVVDMYNRRLTDGEASMKVASIFKMNENGKATYTLQNEEICDWQDEKLYKTAKLVADMCKRKLSEDQITAEINSLFNIHSDRVQIRRIISKVSLYIKSQNNGHVKNTSSHAATTNDKENTDVAEENDDCIPRDFD